MSTSFLVSIPLLFCLVLQATLQGLYWLKVKKCTPLFQSQFPGNALRFSTFSIILPIDLGYVAFIIKYVPSIPIVLKAFIIKGCWTLSNVFPTYNMISVLWSTNILESLLDLYTLNHPCISGVKPTWSRRIVFLHAIELSLTTTYWEFLHQYLSGRLAYNLFCCPYPVLVSGQ